MKAKWEGERPRKTRLFGLYIRKSIWRKKLLCYFIDKRDAIETARHMGSSYSICKLQREPQKCPF
jgi:hypothetical protein